MNKFLVTFGLIFMLVSISSLIMNFFGIPHYLFMPYVAWLVALCLFYLILEENHENIFMKGVSVSSGQ